MYLYSMVLPNSEDQLGVKFVFTALCVKMGCVAQESASVHVGGRGLLKCNS